MCIRPTQPETPRLHNCPQFVHAMHDNWDVHFIITSHESTRYITSSLYAVFSSSFPLPFTQSCAKWLQTCPPFWLLSFTPRGPDPCPSSLRKEHKSAQCEAGLVHPKYVGVIRQHVHLVRTTKKLLILLFDRRMVLLISTTAKCSLIAMQFASFPNLPCTSRHAQRGCLHFECMPH